MKRLRFVVSLITQDNDYQVEQAAAAEEAARHLGIDARVIYADSDSIQQSQQILHLVQSDPATHPDGILVEPAGGTGLPQVAQAAVAAGIAWVVMNREVGYVKELRQKYSAPVFAVASDHLEIGRIQGRQLKALLPEGGSVLYIQGPAETDACKFRSAGMYEAKSPGVQIKAIKGNWTEASAFKAVMSWLRLSTSQQSRIDVIAAQNDAMAVGARKAFQQFASEGEGRGRWLEASFVGVDGVPRTGQAWVRSGTLKATVIVPPLSGNAMEILVRALRDGVRPPELTLIAPKSYPELDSLAESALRKSRSAGLTT